MLWLFITKIYIFEAFLSLDGDNKYFQVFEFLSEFHIHLASF